MATVPSSSFHLDCEREGMPVQHPTGATSEQRKKSALTIALGAIVGMIGFWVCEPIIFKSGDGIISFDSDCVREHLRAKDATLDMLKDCEVTNHGLGVAKFFMAPQIAPRSHQVRAASPRMQSFEEYAKSRGKEYQESQQELEDGAAGYQQEYDGGDAGGGVLGDGNFDLEDQHDNPKNLINREGAMFDMYDVDALGAASGSGMNVMKYDDKPADNDEDDEYSLEGLIDEGEGGEGKAKVTSATQSRVASAGVNYYGRNKGEAGRMQKDFVAKGVEEVRAQQFQNYYNQRAINKGNREFSQGVLYGEGSEMNMNKQWNTQDMMNSGTWGVKASKEISTDDLNKQVKELAKEVHERLDGEPWEWPPTRKEINGDGNCEIEQELNFRATVNSLEVQKIEINNPFNLFLPYVCGFTIDSQDEEFEVVPPAGTFNRRDSKEPVEFRIFYKPKTPTIEPKEAYLVCETEEFKKVYKLTGRT